MSDHLDPEELLRIAVEAASEAGRLLGIPIIDHVVTGGRSYRSIAEWMGGAF